MKQALIYGDINEYSARDFINGINETGDEDILVRVNTNGGSVDFGWGMLSRFKEATGKKLIKNDGKAYSMGAFAFLYADDREAIDVAEFMLHRCGYPPEWEADPHFFTPEDRARIERKNKSLQKAFEAKCDVAKFEEITGVSVKELFAMDGTRPEVFLTAQQAKKIGLIDRIVPFTPQKKNEIKAMMLEAEAKYSPAPQIAAHKETSSKTTEMTAAQLKAENPAVYAEIFGLGVTAGKQEEKERNEAWAHFVEVDAKAVKEGITSGKVMTQLQMIELTQKQMAPKEVQAHEDGSEKNPVQTAPAPGKEKTKEQKEIEAFVEGAKSHSAYFSGK